jgi:hypothetical protein
MMPYNWDKFRIASAEFIRIAGFNRNACCRTPRETVL